MPLANLPSAIRQGVRLVLEQPTLFVQGPTQVFRGRPAMYHWLLDHPDQAVLIWRQLGAKCSDITSSGAGSFCWTDGQGSQIHWETLCCGPRLRVWYAEGSARPGPLLPLVPVRAVVVLRFAEAGDSTGRTLIHHQADAYLQTDSKTAARVARLLGASAPRLAEQGVAQLEMFFSALVWYLDRHPERAEALQLGSLLPDFSARSAIR